VKKCPRPPLCRLLLHVGLPLLIGGLIYLAWRSPTLTMFRWLNVAGVTVQPLREAVAIFPPPADLIVFSLPNALWGYALVSFFCLLWKHQYDLAARIWIAAACTLALAAEIGQAVHIVPGTFDPLDQLTAMAAICVALWRHRRFDFMKEIPDGSLAT